MGTVKLSSLRYLGIPVAPTLPGETVADGATLPEALTQLEAATEAITTPMRERVTVEWPSSSEDVGFAFFPSAVTIESLRAVLTGSESPSVTWTLRHGTDRSGVGSEIVTGGTTTTNTTTGQLIVTFDNAAIPAGTYVWLETTAKGGTVSSIQILLTYS